MTNSASQHSSRTTRIWIAVLVALAVLSFLAMRRSLGKAMQMQVQATSSASLPQLKVGEEVKVVVEITSVLSGSIIQGTLLEKQTETVYHRSGNSTKIAFEPSTPVVMGKVSDIHQGAIVHIKAKMGEDHVLHAEQIVVLTGYVKVQ
jgi:hypothetical protein